MLGAKQQRSIIGADRCRKFAVRSGNSFFLFVCLPSLVCRIERVESCAGKYSSEVLIHLVALAYANLFVFLFAPETLQICNLECEWHEC